jgi:hypothetical protein
MRRHAEEIDAQGEGGDVASGVESRARDSANPGRAAADVERRFQQVAEAATGARALAACRKESAARSHQLDSMLRTRSWEGVAKFVAGCAQSRELNLKPWQGPPCNASLDDLAKPAGDQRGEREIAELLQRLLDAGLSRFEPSPLEALKQVGRNGLPGGVSCSH